MKSLCPVLKSSNKGLIKFELICYHKNEFFIFIARKRQNAAIGVLLGVLLLNIKL